jgi:hypothetical protein
MKVSKEIIISQNEFTGFFGIKDYEYTFQLDV